MLQVQKGQPLAFEILMQKHYKRVLNFIYRVVGDRQVAEDLTQEVFIRVYKSSSRYHPQARFQT
jgi:RNA polymerase sigma-70 factor (ECF subfamily)